MCCVNAQGVELALVRTSDLEIDFRNSDRAVWGLVESSPQVLGLAYRDRYGEPLNNRWWRDYLDHQQPFA
jgi:hypothetical protein